MKHLRFILPVLSLLFIGACSSAPEDASIEPPKPGDVGQTGAGGACGGAGGAGGAGGDGMWMPPPPPLCIESLSPMVEGSACKVTDDCLSGWETPCNMFKCIPGPNGAGTCQFTEATTIGKPCGRTEIDNNNTTLEWKCDKARNCCVEGLP